MKKFLFILILLSYFSSGLFAAPFFTKKVTFIGKGVMLDWGISYKVDGGPQISVVVPPTDFKIDIRFQKEVTFFTKKPSTSFKITKDSTVLRLFANFGMPSWEMLVEWGNEKSQGYVPVPPEYYFPEDRVRMWMSNL
jgi:hypothetical protein